MTNQILWSAAPSHWLECFDGSSRRQYREEREESERKARRLWAVGHENDVVTEDAQATAKAWLCIDRQMRFYVLGWCFFYSLSLSYSQEIRPTLFTDNAFLKPIQDNPFRGVIWFTSIPKGGIICITLRRSIVRGL